MMHYGWYMVWYHILGGFVIAGITIIYATLAALRLRPSTRNLPVQEKELEEVRDNRAANL
jgi:hypothetical protein